MAVADAATAKDAEIASDVHVVAVAVSIAAGCWYDVPRAVTDGAEVAVDPTAAVVVGSHRESLEGGCWRSMRGLMGGVEPGRVAFVVARSGREIGLDGSADEVVANMPEHP